MTAPFRKILVGVDGSAPSLAALQLAGRVAARTKVPVEVIRAWDVTLPDDSEDEVRGLCDDLVALGVEFTARALPGDPRNVLVDTLRSEGADLLVVGDRGHGGFLGLGLGSMAHYVAHHVTVPVAIVPQGAQIGGGPVIAGLDGSEANDAAAEWAAALAGELDRSVLAVLAVEPLADSYPHGTQTNWKYVGQAEVEDQLDRVRGAFPDVTFELELAHAHPVPGLVGVAERRDAPVIVVGTKGRAGFAGTLLGHVPMQLAHHSTRPVVIVPHGHGSHRR